MSRFSHDDQVLDADAEGAGAVVAGLVGEDHARLQRRRAELRDALRPFVHREIGADAVARAVVEVEPGLPQRRAARRRRVCAPETPLGNTGGRDGDVALQHAREMIPHVASGSADDDRARDVGRAVEILRAGIDEIDAAPDLAIAFLASRDNAASPHVRPKAEMVGKEMSRKSPPVAAKGFQRLRRIDFRELAQSGASRANQARKFDHSGAVAQMRGAGAGDLRGVLYGLEQRDRVVADARLAAGGTKQADEF